MLDKLIYFKTHYLAIIWIIGLIFGAILLGSWMYDNYKFKKLVKQKELDKQKLLKSKSL